ncbi:hypothetical protein NE237_004179 [Protea cynaroides]|uniref:Uncharacterized protein n=1 Tax=Protea cynaroides TaxID=273540 RepID=A0A9Q0QT44_9MAGN|nr:hypothetical protein NE237_004179 [Protea cynaroides]
MGNSPIKLLVPGELILAKVEEKEMVERFGAEPGSNSSFEYDWALQCSLQCEGEDVPVSNRNTDPLLKDSASEKASATQTNPIEKRTVPVPISLTVCIEEINDRGPPVHLPVFDPEHFERLQEERNIEERFSILEKSKVKHIVNWQRRRWEYLIPGNQNLDLQAGSREIDSKSEEKEEAITNNKAFLAEEGKREIKSLFP